MRKERGWAPAGSYRDWGPTTLDHFQTAELIPPTLQRITLVKIYMLLRRAHSAYISLRF